MQGLSPLEPMSEGTAHVTVTATATPMASGVEIIEQTQANVARFLFPVEVTVTRDPGALRDPLILSRESIRRNRSVEQTSPTGWTLHNVARPG